MGASPAPPRKPLTLPSQASPFVDPQTGVIQQQWLQVLVRLNSTASGAVTIAVDGGREG